MGNKLDLTRYQNKMCGGYSGGMDPKARRFLWNVISSVMMAGRTIILTSHSMEECEALCTRLAIMVGGEFKCLGSQQHLKNKFGHGYTVIIKVAGEEPDVKPLKAFMESTFSRLELQEEHHGQIQFQVSDPDMTLGRIFGSLEAQREPLNIEDYSVSQTTLEEVFLNFARKEGSGDHEA